MNKNKKRKLLKKNKKKMKNHGWMKFILMKHFQDGERILEEIFNRVFLMNLLQDNIREYGQNQIENEYEKYKIVLKSLLIFKEY